MAPVTSVGCPTVVSASSEKPLFNIAHSSIHGMPNLGFLIGARNLNENKFISQYSFLRGLRMGV